MLEFKAACVKMIPLAPDVSSVFGVDSPVLNFFAVFLIALAFFGLLTIDNFIILGVGGWLAIKWAKII